MEEVYSLEIAIFDDAHEVGLGWQRFPVTLEPSDQETPLPGHSPFRWGYTATSPGPPMQAHVGSNKTSVFRKFQAGQFGG